MEKIKQPYWPALKLILSSLIVFSFYLKQSHTPDFSLLINIFDLTLIPMFVFIIGFITKNGTWKSWRDNLLAALVIYATFQTIDMIPLYYSGQFDLNTYLLFLKTVFGFFLLHLFGKLFSYCYLHTSDIINQYYSLFCLSVFCYRC
ncbi:hypothetical protein ACU42Y_04925 [Proteus mirabilis]